MTTPSAIHFPSCFVALGLLLPLAALPADHGAPAGHGAPAKVEKAERAEKADAHGTKVATASPTVPADAMDQLRQRLAEKLSNGKAPDGAAQAEVRVSVKSAPAPAAGGHGGPVKKSAAKAKVEDGHGHADGPAHWAYNGTGGPQAWSSLKPEFAACATGQRQSPIDIRGGLSVDLEPVRFEYQSSRFAVVDNGHTVQVNLPQGNAIEVGGKRYELLQFHFHRPSEERIDGRQFEMSLHLVHKNDQGQLAVVGLLFDKGQANAVMQQVWNNLPLEKNEEMQAGSTMELADLLPNDRRYFTYMGSLTTPPCSEGVKWIVMRQPVTLTKEQIDIFARMYPMNARPIQSASGRRIMQSN
jgi:carbonic anhydrase